MRLLTLLALTALSRPALADPCETLRTLYARAVADGRELAHPDVRAVLQACDAGWDETESEVEAIPQPHGTEKADLAAWLASTDEDRCSQIRRDYADLQALGGDTARFTGLIGDCPAPVAARAKPPPPRAVPPAPVMASWTFIKARVTSGFGWRKHPVLKRRMFHKGVDFAIHKGERVPSLAAGNVVFAGTWGGYGEAVVVEHAPGKRSLYAHNSRLLVAVGDHVVGGQALAEAGSTGLSTGPHVHLEVRVDGVSRDPMPFVESPYKLLTGSSMAQSVH